MEEIKVLDLFSGYGGSEFALKLANIPHKCIGYSDIETCANYVFALNHGENIPQLGDITKINPEDLPDFDLCTFGFPCQSFSISGKREGFASANKGKLFFEVIRILENKKPRYALGENVQGLLSHDNGKTMRVILNELKRVGYYVKWKLLFSKEHGTPQNRPRVWFACFRELEDYNKFMFPEKEKLKITVKDLLEDEVDEKYYLNENQFKKIEEGIKKENFSFYSPPEDLNKPFKTLKAHMERDKNDVPYFSVVDYRYDEGVRPRKDGVAPTLASSQKSGQGLSGCPIILTGLQEHQQLKTDGIMNTLNSAMGLGGGHTPIIIDNKTKNPNESGISNTVRAGGGSGNNILTNYKNRWRRLTPRECFRLQGFFNDEIKFGELSDSKLYFLAGNGWDINVAHKIFIQMFKGNKLNKQKGLFEL